MKPARRALAIAAGAMFAAVASAAQPVEPRFEAYPVTEIFRGKAVPPNVQRGRARLFRTMLRTGAAGGPNFAGHYTVVNWGCGTCCNEFAIVDAVSGSAYFPPFVAACEEPYEPQWGGKADLDFRLDSELFVVTGARVFGRRWGGVLKGGKFFYRWNGTELVFIAAVH